MKKGIIISGFGGQGVMLAGNILCRAGMKEDKFVTFFPSYGAEMRGGTANCQVIISDTHIGAPVVQYPDILLSFNKPSYVKFSPRVKKEGRILVNSSLYKPEENPGPELIGIPANDIARECGSPIVLNMVMIGAFAAGTKILGIGSVKDSVPEVLTEKKKNLWDINIRAVEAGYNYLGK
ncbi:MAG: 2-oxoacid:acceptor oxidoreductase family protein [Elusimicrobia bacterium]|nr:2-oxoacid:acceptor oxidoreductase family protein [Elusimicrobiota bacterium]